MADTLDTGVGVRKVSNTTPGLEAKRLDFSEIPVLDFSPMETGNQSEKQALAKKLFEACTQVGFFYVTNHGVPESAIKNMQLVSKTFFDQPIEKKLAIDIKHSSFNRGYIPMFGEKNNEHSKGDLKETFDVAIEVDKNDQDFLAGNPLYGPNQWPDDLPEFKDAMQTYFSAVTQLCHRLYRAFALALGLPETHFDSMQQKPLDILRLLRYPPQPVVENEDQIGTGAHSDFDCFTVLHQDPTGGLQALNSHGEWIDAVPVEGSFLINVGDMLERWTNGLFVSTVHRVINRSGNERYSTVFFAAPNYHTKLDCLPGCSSDDNPARFQSISAGDYIVSRYEAILTEPD